MKLGFLTACLPGLPLRDIAGWAAASDFAALEVATWPDGGPRHIDAERLDAAGATELRDELAGLGLTISALAYYENNLHPDPAVRERVHRHLRACVEAARLLGVPAVGTFVGRDVTRSVRDNVAEAERVLPPLVEHAAARGVTLMVENCPMAGWHPDGYPANLAYSPELWDWLAGMGLRLNFDPSHLVGLGIDPVGALRGAVANVAHVQAKDAEVLPGAIERYGFYGKAIEPAAPGDHTWWRFRVPGLGQVDWRRIVDVLYENGFAGTVSIEHEDPVWSGSAGRVKSGLLIGHRTLAPLLVG